MADWTSHLTKAEAKAILDAKIKTRFEGRDSAGQRTTRYSQPSAAELARIREKAR